MAGKINVTPQQLQSIINSVDHMRREIVDAAEVLKKDTNQIQTVWNDDQFEIFKDTVSSFHKQLSDMASRLEREGTRLQNYKSDSERSMDNFNG
jgi:uncharacterized protein YukE